MSTKSSREYFLDLLRIVAAFLVIVNHTNSTIFLRSTPDSTRWFISLAYFYVSKVAVPIFFMISGYLMLGNIDSWKKSLKRFLRIVIILFACAVIYSIYNNVYEKAITAPSVIIKSFLDVYRTSPSNAFWYLYAYLGILLMLPFLQRMVQNMSKKDFHIFFIVSGIFYSVMPILSHYSAKAKFNPDFQLPIFTGFICLLFIGQYFKRFGIKKTKLGFGIALLTFVAMIILNVVMTRVEYEKSTTKYLFFDNVVLLPIMIESVCCFYMFSFATFGQRISKIISYIGSCTFGIYLISDMTISYFRPYYLNLSKQIHPLIAVFFFEIFIFSLGLFITIILKKTPGVKKYL